MSATGVQVNPGEFIPGTKYRVVKSLGAGGMGIVYQVVKPPNIGGVMKLMSTELTAHQEHRMRFFDEVRILAQLDHPNIVKVFDYDALPDGTPFYVMELLSGRTVRDAISTMGRMPPRVAYEVTRQLCEALQAAHTHEVPVIHRDIKPENIFLHAPRHGEPVVKLIDFGVSAVADRKHDGSFVGTWSYAAPEQIRGEKPSPATDLYAAGLVLYEMLSGVGPFDHYDDWTQISEAQLKEIPAPVSKFAPWVPPSIVALIASALAKDPRQRPRDAYSFAERLFELEWASDGKDPHDFTIEGPTPSPPDAVAAAAAARASQRPRPDTPIAIAGNGPLSRMLSSVTSSQSALARVNGPKGDIPLAAAVPESVRTGSTDKGIGKPPIRLEPTSPDANALLAGLGGEARKPPSRRERESDPDDFSAPLSSHPSNRLSPTLSNMVTEDEVSSPRAGQVVIRAGRHASDPQEAAHGLTTPRPMAAIAAALPGDSTHEEDIATGIPSHRAAAAAPQSNSRGFARDTFSSQQSDPRGVPNRSKLPLFLIAFALLLSGVVIAIVIVRRAASNTAANTTNVTAATSTSVATGVATMPSTSTPATSTSTLSVGTAAASPSIVAEPTSIPSTHPSAKTRPTSGGAVKTAAPTSPAQTPPAASSARGDYFRNPI